MDELHITSNDGVMHARQYEGETTWAVEIAGHAPKLARQLLATGATQRPGYDSVVADASTEQLISFLATANGYRCKLAKKKRRQYSEDAKAAMRERLALAREKA